MLMLILTIILSTACVQTLIFMPAPCGGFRHLVFSRGVCSLSPQASLDGRISKLEETLERVGSTAGRLKELLAQEGEWRERLENHPPPRVLPPDIEKQRTEFSVSFK